MRGCVGALAAGLSIHGTVNSGTVRRRNFREERVVRDRDVNPECGVVTVSVKNTSTSCAL